jgi:putative membrane protein
LALRRLVNNLNGGVRRTIIINPQIPESMKTKSSHLKIRVTTGAATALFLLALAAPALRAQEKENHGEFTAKDFKFATTAAEGGSMEVALGDLAAQKGEDQAVRDFGKRMVDDHKKLNDELKDLAVKKGATIPTMSTKKDDKMVERLQKLSGKEFDKAYIKEMVGDHKKDIKEFQTEAEKGDDADLKAWVTKTLPTLLDHLAQAQKLDAMIVASKSQ